MKLALSLLLLGQMLPALGASAVEIDPAATYSSQTYGVQHAKGFVQSQRNRDFILHSQHQSFTGTLTPVPGKHSLRGHAGPVEDQGSCGSCWDFSLTSVLRGTWIMSGKDPGRLSFNYLLNCASTMQGCDGGDFTAAQFFVGPQGAPAYGSDGVYTGVASTCVQKPAIASTVSYTLLGTDLGQNPSAPTPTFQDIAYVVGVLHQPVSIDVAADQTWQSYVSGIYNGCSDENAADIDHMVVVEGYDCESSVDSSGHCVFDSNGHLPAGVGTWLIRNSWGTTWGDHGYITTKATDKNGAACNAVATDALYYNITGK